MSMADIFKALSSPARRDILTLLRKNYRMSAGEIAEKFDTTNATISHHLLQLKKAELIYETKNKNSIYYQLNTSVFEETIIWISQFKELKGDDFNEK